jgi:hypothetical protein
METYPPHFAYCNRTRLKISRYGVETEIGSFQDGGEVKKSNNAQRHGPWPIRNS